MMNLFQASLVLLSLFTVILAQNDEFYCETKADQWQVCRTCNDSKQGYLLRGTIVFWLICSTKNLQVLVTNFCLP